MLPDNDEPPMRWSDLPFAWVKSFLLNNGHLPPDDVRTELDADMLASLNSYCPDELYFMEERRRPLVGGGWEYPVFQYELRYVDAFKNGEEFDGTIIAGSGHWFFLADNWAWLDVFADKTTPEDLSDLGAKRWNWLSANCRGDWYVVVEEGPEGWSGNRNLRTYLPNDEDALLYRLTFGDA